MAQQLYRDYSVWLTAVEPRLRWVQLNRRQFRALAALVGLGFFLAAALLISRMAVLKSGYAVVALRQERDDLLMERRRLERRLRELLSLEHAEAVARRDLGMVDINPNQVIYLPDPAVSAPRRFWRALFGD